MSLMAGFDIVTELSQDSVLKLLKNNLVFGGAPANPPFEFSVPLSGAITGQAHLVILDLQLELKNDDSFVLTFIFDRSSATMTAPTAATACPLVGAFDVKVKPKLTSDTSSTQQLLLDMASAIVTLSFTADSELELVNDLGTSPAIFIALATTALQNYIRSTVPEPLMTFDVLPGADGSLAPLRYESIAVHCISNVDKAKQGLGFFGILLKNNHGNGNHANKTVSAITSSNNGMCMSLSPKVFEVFFFCKALAAGFGVSVSNLPPTCGHGGSIELESDLKVNKLDMRFASNKIEITGNGEKRGTCYRANFDFLAKLTLSLSGFALVPHLDMGDPDVDVDIPWYCEVAASIGTGAFFLPVGIYLTGVVELTKNAIVNAIVDNSLLDGAFNGFPGMLVPVVSGVLMQGVQISTSGLTMQGVMLMSMAGDPSRLQLSLDGSVTTTNRDVLSNGVFRTAICPETGINDYSYTELALHQTATYSITGELVPVPFTPKYFVDAIPLTESNGTVEIANVTTLYAASPGGGFSIQQDVHIGYSISGATIQLTNDPADGNFVVRISATAVDCNGATILDSAGVPLKVFKLVMFIGNDLELEGQYQEDAQTCTPYLIDRMRREMAIVNLYDRFKERMPEWQWKNYPLPEDMVKLIGGVALSQKLEDVLHTLQVLHGDSFYRAMLSEYARSPMLSKQSIDAFKSVTRKCCAK